MNPYKNINLKCFFESFSQEEKDENTRLQTEENERVHNEFLDGLKIGKCFLCGGDLDTFDERKECFHWFTYPHGIKKKHFEEYLRKPIGFFQLDIYFRWLATVEKPLVNINDLKSESSSTSYLETTYKYKNLEWAFSVGKTDLDGHKGGKYGAKPHFHIQMRVDGRIFLNFNYFHIPFSDQDLFTITLLNQAPDKVKLGHTYGYGVGIMEDKELLDVIDNSLRATDDIANAPFNRRTLFVAAEGQQFQGEMIQRAIDESKITRQPISKIMQRLLTESKIDAHILSVITPSDGVPEMVKRSGKK